MHLTFITPGSSPCVTASPSISQLSAGHDYVSPLTHSWSQINTPCIHNCLVYTSNGCSVMSKSSSLFYRSRINNTFLSAPFHSSFTSTSSFHSTSYYPSSLAIFTSFRASLDDKTFARSEYPRDNDGNVDNDDDDDGDDDYAPSSRAMTTSIAPNAMFNAMQDTKQAFQDTMASKPAKYGDTLLIDYLIMLDDGSDEILQNSREVHVDEPAEIKIGGGSLFKAFEEMLIGSRPGTVGVIHLSPAEAFGTYKDVMVFDTPLSSLSTKVQEGDQICLPQIDPNAFATIKKVDEANDKVTIDLNHPYADQKIKISYSVIGYWNQLYSPVPAYHTPQRPILRAVFAAGNFWGVELAFQRVNGVVKTKVGYTGGMKKRPSYEEVMRGTVGHAQAVAVDYDPQMVSYQDLLQVFWQHLGDAAITKNEAGEDVGAQYRSIIFCSTPQEEQIAIESAAQRSKLYKVPVVTTIQPMDTFWVAEQYHQRVLERNGQNAEKGCTDPIKNYS